MKPKKVSSKLVLNKKTISVLGREDIRHAAGGVGTVGNSCDCTFPYCSLYVDSVCRCIP